jgi:hypothetical protein
MRSSPRAAATGPPARRINARRCPSTVKPGQLNCRRCPSRQPVQQAVGVPRASTRLPSRPPNPIATAPVGVATRLVGVVRYASVGGTSSRHPWSAREKPRAGDGIASAGRRKRRHLARRRRHLSRRRRPRHGNARSSRRRTRDLSPSIADWLWAGPSHTREATAVVTAAPSLVTAEPSRDRSTPSRSGNRHSLRTMGAPRKERCQRLSGFLSGLRSAGCSSIRVKENLQ